MSEPIHLHQNRVNINLNVLLLLFPTIVFGLILYLLLVNFKMVKQKEEIATLQETNVLGEESNLDTEPENLSE